MALVDELHEIARECVWYDILDTDELIEKYENYSGSKVNEKLDLIIDDAVSTAQKAAEDAIWSVLCSRRREVIDILEED